jgi:HSP20 family protein
MASKEIRSADRTPSRPSQDIFSIMRNEMDRLFERFESGWPRWPSARGEGTMKMPELDVRENNEAILIEAELPGVDEKDVSVTLANGVLTIKGEKTQDRQEKRDDYHLAERTFGSFQRSVRLPDSIDENKVEAKFDKGVLKVTAAKRPEAVKAERKIAIGRG